MTMSESRIGQSLIIPALERSILTAELKCSYTRRRRRKRRGLVCQVSGRAFMSEEEEEEREEGCFGMLEK